MKNFFSSILLVLSSVVLFGQSPTLSSIALPNISSGYTAGATYNLNILYSASAPFRSAYMIISNQTTPTEVGVADASLQAIVHSTVQGNDIIVYSDTTSNNAWTFKWTAPSAGQTIKFEIIGKGYATATGAHNVTASSTFYVSESGLVNGINEFAEEIDLSVYPNPVTEQVTIEYKLKGSEQVNIDLFDLAGKKIETLLIEKQIAGNYINSYQLPVNIIPGTYFVRIQAGEGVAYKQITKL